MEFAKLQIGEKKLW